MRVSGRGFALIIGLVIILCAGIYMMVSHGSGPDILPLSQNTYPRCERFCLMPGDNGKVLTAFWGRVVNETGIDDSSAVLLSFSMDGYPDKMPRQMHFTFASKKDGWGGSRMVILMGDDQSDCGCYKIQPNEDRWLSSSTPVPSPGELFRELEQVPFSDLGVGGKELFVTTSVRSGPPYDSSENLYLLTNGSVVPLQDFVFDPKATLAYVWTIQTMEMTGEPGQREWSSRPGVWVVSGTRLNGITP
jgi:hypothetical protein